MPTELKQRKKSPKQSDGVNETSAANGEDETPKAEPGNPAGENKTSSSWDILSLMCVVSLAACAALSWLVLRQNERFSEMEEKYRSLNGRTSSLFDMEEDVLKVSEKLAASEDDLREALAAVSLATRLEQEISALHAAVAAMRDDENSASRDLQAVNAHFLNVTETWQQRLAAVSSDLAALKAASREAHAGATERVNDGEQRGRSLAERLEELEDSTGRNARALERAEGADTRRAEEHLDWNTEQVHKLEERLRGLTAASAQLAARLEEHVPRARECEEHLPQVEEAVRSILRLAADLSAAERRLEEVTLQVFGTEDSMLKALNEILELRQELDTLQAQNSVLKMKNELSVVKEAVRELTLVLRGNAEDTPRDSDAPEEEAWNEEEEEEEEEVWEEDHTDETTQLLHDDLPE
ncbi:inhibitor of nuclear factor kappa-B kinase-interacting protein isoform X1 [Pungitius pungitius]|uniref:inhibitor of nuclear factor kappa-B kinase-interacting protein isoform X1 n=1 Tax=Pungitius pungitius TaxID=134920 RepID=UPI002E11916C